MSSNRSTVYVGKLSDKTRERDLEDTFNKYGKISTVSVKFGYGFVEFEDSRDADEAVKHLDGYELDGSRLIVEHSRGPRDRDRDRRDRDYDRRDDRRSSRRGGPPVRTSHRAVVDNLSSSCNWRDLKDLCRDVSRVSPTFADVFRDGYGIVEFETRDDLKRVLKDLDDYKFQGKRVTVKEDSGRDRDRDRYEPYSSRGRRSRTPSPRRGGSRSPSPSPRKRSPSPRKRTPSPRKRSPTPEANGSKRSRSRS